MQVWKIISIMRFYQIWWKRNLRHLFKICNEKEMLPNQCYCNCIIVLVVVNECAKKWQFYPKIHFSQKLWLRRCGTRWEGKRKKNCLPSLIKFPCQKVSTVYPCARDNSFKNSKELEFKSSSYIYWKRVKIFLTKKYPSGLKGQPYMYNKNLKPWGFQN